MADGLDGTGREVLAAGMVIAQRAKREGKGAQARRFRTLNWMTFRSAHTTLFIYLHVIVLRTPGIVAINLSQVRRVVHEKKEVEHMRIQ